MRRDSVESRRADDSLFERVKDRILGGGDPTEERDDPTDPGIPTPP